MFYPEHLVEEVRQRNDIVDVISSYVKLQKKGANHMGLCPFHGEKTPSFSVSGAKQMYHCFGCGVGGNVVTFIMEYENYTFVEAIKLLAQRAGITLPELSDSKEERKQADLKKTLLDIYKKTAKYYYYQLRTEGGKVAMEYLVNRQISNEAMQKFGLGYSQKTSGDLYNYLKKDGYTDELLKQTGLFTMDESRGVYDKFWNRIMFPIMDVNNRVIGFGGRVLGDGMPKYLNSPETKLFDKSRNLYGLNIARISREKYILLCEGYLDVIALHQAGFTNAVASLGTAFTGLQANLLKRYTEEVLITYDSDSAGIKAALRAIPILKDAGISVKVIDMNPYKDPDEFIKSLGADEFEKRINEGKNSFYFEVDVLEQSYDLTDPERKTKFYNEIAQKLLIFTEEIERNNYIEAIANRYNIGFENLRKLVNQYGSRIVINRDEYVKEHAYTKKEKDAGIKQSQKILLTWLAVDGYLLPKIQGIIKPEDFKDELYYKAAKFLFSQFEQGEEIVPAKIINQFESREEQNEVASIFNAEFQNDLNFVEKEKAFNETIIRVKKYSLEYDSSHATDVSALQEIIREQAKLQKLHISFKDG